MAENKYAQVLRWIADGEIIQWQSKDGEWGIQDWEYTLSEIAANEYGPGRYRRKPRTLKIAGKTIEAPLVTAAHGSDAYACSAASAVNHITCNINSEEHADALTNGRLFATPEAAKAAYDAITALLTGRDAA